MGTRDPNRGGGYRVRHSVGGTGEDLTRRKEGPELKKLYTEKVPKEGIKSGKLDRKIDSLTFKLLCHCLLFLSHLSNFCAVDLALSVFPISLYSPTSHVCSPVSSHTPA